MNHKTIIIAEAGVNHNGSLDVAKELIKVASEAKADYVKFQTFKATDTITKNAEKANYQKNTTDQKENQFSIKRLNGTLKNIKTIGQKWSTFQYLNFKTASQPFYVLITSDGELLNDPIQYADKTVFKNWLNKGLENFNKN